MKKACAILILAMASCGEEGGGDEGGSVRIDGVSAEAKGGVSAGEELPATFRLTVDVESSGSGTKGSRMTIRLKVGFRVQYGYSFKKGKTLIEGTTTREMDLPLGLREHPLRPAGDKFKDTFTVTLADLEEALRLAVAKEAEERFKDAGLSSKDPVEVKVTAPVFSTPKKGLGVTVTPTASSPRILDGTPRPFVLIIPEDGTYAAPKMENR